MKLVFGQSKKNMLNLSPKAKEKRLVLKTSFSLCFRTGTSALPTALCLWISKMPSKLRKNTMPRRFAPRQFLTISQKVKIGGVFWTKFELSLSKTPTKEASPVVARKPRHPAKKFSSQFLICARRIFSSKRKRKLFCWLLLLTEQAAGLASIFCKNTAEFPPHPPSAVFLRGWTEILAATF